MIKRISLAVPIIMGTLGLGSMILLLVRMNNLIQTSGIGIQCVLMEKRWFTPFVHSFFISVFSAVLTIMAGVWIVRQMAYHSKRVYFQRVLNSSFYYPHFAVAFYIYVSFSFIYPYIGGYEPIYGPVEIITTYFLKEVPFVVFYLYPTYQKISQDEIDLYHLFNKGRKRGLWWTVEWPKTAPQLAELMVILISFIWTAYEVPSIVGNSYPPFLSIVLFNQYMEADPGSRLQSMVLMVIVTIILLLLSFILFAVTWQYRRHISHGSDQI
ncbi:hypothetical protein [Terrilactibacillus laevilacticus]|uniref:hypothetical protein n=1 Tax=Terrilactibacillus laevilacticus TaxID=1380157 RepID=UPI0011461DD5|nr:hypothetical protein [Terrilactibacillus laevilacticus]